MVFGVCTLLTLTAYAAANNSDVGTTLLFHRDLLVTSEVSRWWNVVTIAVLSGVYAWFAAWFSDFLPDTSFGLCVDLGLFFGAICGTGFGIFVGGMPMSHVAEFDLQWFSMTGLFVLALVGALALTAVGGFIGWVLQSLWYLCRRAFRWTFVDACG
jgi:hypothetical protein